MRALSEVTLDEVNDAKGKAIRNQFKQVQKLCNREPRQI